MAREVPLQELSARQRPRCAPIRAGRPGSAPRRVCRPIRPRPYPIALCRIERPITAGIHDRPLRGLAQRSDPQHDRVRGERITGCARRRTSRVVDRPRHSGHPRAARRGAGKPILWHAHAGRVKRQLSLARPAPLEKRNPRQPSLVCQVQIHSTAAGAGNASRCCVR